MKNKKVKIKKEDKLFSDDFQQLELVKIILELEKEIRDRIDISTTMFGLLFAGGAFFIGNDSLLKRDMIKMFLIITSLIASYKYIIIYPIIERIEEIEKKVNVGIPYKKRYFYKKVMLLLLMFIILIVFLTFIIE